jgi:multicomponent Na+:H+ antiporter subunit D
MDTHAPALVVVAPLLSAFLAVAGGWLDRRLCHPIALTGVGIATGASVLILGRVVSQGTFTYRLGGWPEPWGIVYVVDHLNAPVLVAVAVIAFLALLASGGDVKAEFPDRVGPIYGLMVLLVTGLLGIVITGDAFNLYVLLEIASITAYALIAMGKDRAPLSSLHYVFMGTIGACFYLLGVGYLYIMTGSLNMADIAAILPPLYGSRAVLVAFIITMVGMWLKMGFFPLHSWLPNAYTHAPSAVSTLIAPLMTKVMVYVMIRVVLTLFTPAYAFSTVELGRAVVWLAVIAMVAGSVAALMERDLKRMLAFLIVAEVGYMVGGLWTGSRSGITGAVLHILNDALMTFCLFLAVGNIARRAGGSGLHQIGGIFKGMPFTMGAFMVGALSMIGVPPTCGFFSKWYLILGGIESGQYGFVVALLFSSLINVAIFFRAVEAAYFAPGAAHHGGDGGRPPVAEAPLSMLVPLLAAAVGLVVVGLFTGEIVGRVVGHVVPSVIR